MTHTRQLYAKLLALLTIAIAALVVANASAIAADGKNATATIAEAVLVDSAAQEAAAVEKRSTLQVKRTNEEVATANAKCRTLGDGNLQTRQAAGVFCDVCKIQGCDCNGSECTNCGNKIAAKPAQTASTFCNICAIQGCSCSNGKCVDCKAGSLTAQPPRN